VSTLLDVTRSGGPVPNDRYQFGDHGASSLERTATSYLRDGGLILLLGMLSVTIHAWLIRHTEVAARDSIGFIRYAWELEHQPWGQVVRHSHQHPAYPALLLAMSWPVRHYFGGSDVSVFQQSAQLTSALAGMLLVIPMYFLGRRLLDRRTAFWATALFQCLPLTSRLMADGLSEATFLLFVVTALLFGVLALESHIQRPNAEDETPGPRTAGLACRIWYALCGLFGALAYLTRPEGALILISAGVVMLGMQAYRSWRQPWREWLVHGGIIAGTAIIVASPYCITIGGLTTKPTPRIMLKTARHDYPAGAPSGMTFDDQPSARALSDHMDWVYSPASVFGVFAPATAYNRYWWAVKALTTEVARGFQYFAVFPVILGMWLLRYRLRESPGYWLLLVFCALQGMILWRLATVMGYLSERHVILLVLCGVFPAMGAVPSIARWIIRVVEQARSKDFDSSTAGRSAGWLTFALFAALAFCSLPETLKPLHANRSGHRAAGLWLAQHANPADPVTDPFCWAHYYAGKLFEEGSEPAVPPGYMPTRYVVMEGLDREHSRLPMIPEAKRFADQGTIVYHWPEQAAVEQGKVFVYAVPVRQ
jgi:4-amino-4-deoxy-L-arabinose transferase-like glycosyltransferase